MTWIIAGLFVVGSVGSWAALMWVDHEIDQDFVKPEEWLDLAWNEGEPLEVDYDERGSRRP